MRAAPAYLQIVENLRQRITSGALAPGAKVPSTRAVASEFGVALATATRALAELRDAGLVVARPRSGTVVAIGAAHAMAFGATARRPARALSFEDRLLQDAMALADAEGLDALSMRAVASRLGIATMGLYRYVASKEELIARMSDAAFAEATLPTPKPDGWRACLELVARGQWAIHLRHPWLAHTMSVARPLPLPSALRHAEWLFSAIDGYGLDAATMLHVHVAVFSFVRGLAIDLEPEARARAETGLDDSAWMQTQEARFGAIATEYNLPTFARVLRELAEPTSTYDFNLEGAFEFGLGPLLDGLAPLFDRRHARRPTRT